MNVVKIADSLTVDAVVTSAVNFSVAKQAILNTKHCTSVLIYTVISCFYPLCSFMLLPYLVQLQEKIRLLPFSSMPSLPRCSYIAILVNN